MLAFLLHYHPPEIQDCILLWALGHNNLVKDIHIINEGSIYVGGWWEALLGLQCYIVIIKRNYVNKSITILIKFRLSNISSLISIYPCRQLLDLVKFFCNLTLENFFPVNLFKVPDYNAAIRCLLAGVLPEYGADWLGERDLPPSVTDKEDPADKEYNNSHNKAD